jgi:hypothetical protein
VTIVKLHNLLTFRLSSLVSVAKKQSFHVFEGPKERFVPSFCFSFVLDLSKTVLLSYETEFLIPLVESNYPDGIELVRLEGSSSCLVLGFMPSGIRTGQFWKFSYDISL